jgi:hypothetical protein
MKSKRGLMTVLVGLAMLATPIAAAAKDYKHDDSYAARAARSFTARTGIPAVVTGRKGTWMPAPAAVTRHDWNEHHGWDANAYRNYGNRGYYGTPAYVAAPAYPVAAPYYGGGYGGGGGGGGCGAAERVMRTYSRDRATGHPAAAYDVLRQNQWALHSGCASGAPVGGGLLGGLGGLGGYNGYRAAPAYNNYGNGGLLGGLGGYRGTPAYGNGGYNTGYGQPNGGGLTPLIQQFIR